MLENKFNMSHFLESICVFYMVVGIGKLQNNKKNSKSSKEQVFPMKSRF